MALCAQCYGGGWHPSPHNLCSACKGSGEQPNRDDGRRV
jgi:DnaJ-class molecular chaperone